MHNSVQQPPSAAFPIVNLNGFLRFFGPFGFWLATSAMIFFVALSSFAQSCKSDQSEICANPGASCSPISSGTGSGHCTVTGTPGKPLHCACVGTPPKPGWTFDAGCSDRNAKGKFVCTIVQPDVKHHETDYPKVEFAPGDVVEVAADGCVQTGGAGNTWKRYVNPSGPNSGNLYHGLIRIPTGTKDSALVRVNTVMAHQLLVTGSGVPLSQLFLHLGYEDDDYSDNGYYSHDDGTDGQCKTDVDPVSGGPAYIAITICRGVPCEPVASRFDFDVVSSTLDPNGLPYNPFWSWQLRPENKDKIPDTSMCHNFSTRGSTLGIPDEFMSPSFADCTDQADSNSVDLPIELNGTICNYGKGPYIGDSFAGHVNWFPVTLEGTAGWGDHGWRDDDYTFTFTSEDPGNPLSVNGRDALHIEFDSDETIDHFDSEEWAAFHDAADNNKDEAIKRFDGHTILTGMFGLDAEHDLKAELHPLFALSTRRDNFENDQNDEAWLMFVRNQGDEGYCSSQIWDMGLEDYTVHLPWRPGMTSVDVNWTKTQFVGTDGTSGPTVSAVPPLTPATPDAASGVFVTFHLGAPVPSSYIFDPGASVPYVNGALHLVWTGQPVAETGRSRLTHMTLPATVSTMGGGLTHPVVEDDEVERGLETAISKLTPAQRQQVAKARAIAVTNPSPVHRLPATGAVKIIARSSPLELRTLERKTAAPRHAIKGGPAIRKAKRDAAEQHALCIATNNEPTGLPVNICKPIVKPPPPVVRDHRTVVRDHR